MAVTGFKPVVGSGNQAPGGFDSHPLPFPMMQIILDKRVVFFEPIAVLMLCAFVFLGGCSKEVTPRQMADRIGANMVEFASGSDASLRGLSPVNDRIAWASGTDGTVLRTTTGGSRWENVSVPGAVGVDFRSIHALDAQRAVVLSAGSPARLYRTVDGGASWTLVHEDTRSSIFYDAMRFSDSDFGIAFSDPIDGHLQLISTEDGGQTWRRHTAGASPKTLDGHAGFAASNSGLAIAHNTVCIGLGGATETGQVRIALSRNRGRIWTTTDVGMKASESAGVFSVAMNGSRHIIAVGGDFLQPEQATDNIIVSTNHGRTWHVPEGPRPRGYRSAVSYFPAMGEGVLVAVGPTGMDASFDFGQSWLGVNRMPWHAAMASPDGDALWLSGANGRLGRIQIERKTKSD